VRARDFYRTSETHLGPCLVHCRPSNARLTYSCQQCLLVCSVHHPVVPHGFHKGQDIASLLCVLFLPYEDCIPLKQARFVLGIL
jgi:hypothetical protein